MPTLLTTIAADVSDSFAQGSGLNIDHTRGLFVLVPVLLIVFIALWAAYGVHSKFLAGHLSLTKAAAGYIGVAVLIVLALVVAGPSI